jgi:hypothetical protein
MARRIKGMSALELRKHLLIAESDLNRLQLMEESAALHSGVHTLTDGATKVESIASSTAMLASNLAAIPRAQHANGTTKAWLQTALDGAVLISSVWLALGPRKNGQQH